VSIGTFTIMGFDLMANNENYFRNNCWYWRPIQYLIAIKCQDILPEKKIKSLGYNDGVLITKNQAIKISDRLEKTIDDKKEISKLKKDIMSELGKVYKGCWDIDNFKEFIDFCRKSEGFRIY